MIIKITEKGIKALEESGDGIFPNHLHILAGLTNGKYKYMENDGTYSDFNECIQQLIEQGLADVMFSVNGRLPSFQQISNNDGSIESMDTPIDPVHTNQFSTFNEFLGDSWMSLTTNSAPYNSLDRLPPLWGYMRQTNFKE